MHCASCGCENREGAKFCNECGTPLALRCGACGTQNPGGVNYCSECGAPLTGQPVPSAVPGAAPSSASLQAAPSSGALTSLRQKQPDAERRRLTVMFCDLVGSTALSAQLDPEEWRELVRAYQSACAQVIARYDGHIAQYLGDGLLVYFGYPIAHEDDAARAVRTGLGSVEQLQQLSRQLPYPLQARIGIHTGLVVVGEMGGGEKREQLALGETPNIAARLQGLAAPDTVVVSAVTYQLIQGYFEWQALGSHTVKGRATPLAVYRVLGESDARSHLEVAVKSGLTPLVGRDEEMGLLRRHWENAQAGEGRVVVLSGEPGIGKSRLVQEVKERLVQQSATSVEFRCSPYAQNSAFAPALAHLQRVLHLQRDDTPEVKLAKLQQALAQYHFPQADTLPLLAALLLLPPPPDAVPLRLSPQRQKQKTQEALVAWLVEESERAPVYCVCEDLHWADASTLELLGLLLDQVPTARLLVLLTARPEFTLPWSSHTHLTPLTLARLPRTQVGEMIEKVTGGKPLPAEVQQQIVHKTDGVPLFVEELTKMVLESGFLREVNGYYELTRPLPPLAIPTTLHDSLMARLDRLATAREVAQMGATLGREFPYEFIHAVMPGDEGSLQQALAQLVEAEVLYQRGLPPQARYVFKHALIQEAAYQSLLKSRRQQYHQQIAQVLAERFPETKETQPELLAHHYTEAGLTTQAIPYWQWAGQRAVERSAHMEAISHLTKGLELLKTLPDTPERAQQELTLQLALGDALVPVKGYTAPDVEQTYTRTRELCQQSGETPQLVQVLHILVIFYFNRGELQTARELAEQMMRLAQSVHDRYLLSLAHGALGWTLYLFGELPSARTHLEQAIALYDPQQHPRTTVVNTADLRVECLSFAAWTLWTLGYPDQGRQRITETVALAEGLAHPFSLAFALGCAAVFHLLRREEQPARERAETVIPLATEQGFPHWLAFGTMVRGWALAEQGQVQEGIAEIRHSRAAFLRDLLLAEAYGKVGQGEEGLTLLAKALAFVETHGTRVWAAELYRLKGELTLQSKVQSPRSEVEEEAEECFQKAIEIARRQSAKSWELRAATSLARLWQQQGKREEARQMLVEIYGWFTEGFDTADLQEAKALLEELT